MVKKYRFGNPFRTDAVVENVPVSEEQLPFFTLCDSEKLIISYNMDPKDAVYGLGENVRGINKRGWIYESNCSDEPNHTESKRSLYAAHNFIIIRGRQTFGVFFDYPGKLQFDIGYTKLNEMVITAESADLDVYIIEGESVRDIVKSFRKIIGRSYIPPKWGFGFGQSRWSYMSANEIREVAKSFRDNDMPLDAIYMDIDYMERYKDFTVNKDTFPDLPGLVNELKQDGIRLVPIIDAGVKIEEGYDVYEEGVKNNCFCKDEDGKDFIVAVWPGRSYFPDMLNEKVREWFGGKYKFLLDQGIEGFWNDMNEPSIFYSDKHLKEVFEKLEDFKDVNIDLDLYYKFKALVNVSNNPEDYKSFYHNVNGEKIRHDKVHNLFGYNMTRAAGEAFEKLEPEKRILMFSRSSYIGMHRYGGIWTGDNISWWSHLLLNLKMMPSLNMCGILYCGADIGGFAADTTEDLVLRWTALGLFTPLMRNHAALRTRVQEPYCFENIEAFKNILGIRYGLLPYIYSEYVKAALGNDMYFKPLAFEYPDDDFASQVEDQLLVGESIMIAPVYTQNAEGRYVYLPEEMKLIRMKSMEDIKSQVLGKGHHYVKIALDEVVFFIRPEKIVPCAKAAKCVDDLDEKHLSILHFVQEGATYQLYHDDGFTKDFDNSDHLTTISVSKDGEVSLSNGSINIK